MQRYRCRKIEERNKPLTKRLSFLVEKSDINDDSFLRKNVDDFLPIPIVAVVSH